MILTEVNIEEAENSYFDLIKLSSVLENNEVKEAEIKIEVPEHVKDLNYSEIYNLDLEKIEELLDNNEKVLQVFDEAGNKLQFQFDITANPENIKSDMPVVNLNNWVQVSKLNSIKSLYLMKEGNKEDAFSEAIKILKITNNIDPFRAEYMNFKNLIQASEPELIGKYFNLDNNTEKLLKYKYYYKETKTLNTVANYYHKAINKFNTCDNEINTIIYKPKINLQTYFTENAFGKILANSMKVDLDRIINKKCDIEALSNSTKELFTLRK